MVEQKAEKLKMKTDRWRLQPETPNTLPAVDIRGNQTDAVGTAEIPEDSPIVLSLWVITIFSSML